MIEDATGSGVKVRPLDALLAKSSADGVMQDNAASDAQLASVVSDALKYQNKPYNFAGFGGSPSRNLWEWPRPRREESRV